MIDGRQACQAWFVHWTAMLLFQISLLPSAFWKHFHHYLPHPFPGVQVKLTGLSPHILFFVFLEDCRHILYSLPQESLPFAIILLQKSSTVASQTHWPAPLAPMHVSLQALWNCVCSMSSLIWSSSIKEGPLIHLKNYPLKTPYLK